MSGLSHRDAELAFALRIDTRTRAPRAPKQALLCTFISQPRVQESKRCRRRRRKCSVEGWGCVARRAARMTARCRSGHGISNDMVQMEVSKDDVDAIRPVHDVRSFEQALETSTCVEY